MSSKEQDLSRFDRIANRINRLPRRSRILIAMGVSLMIMALVGLPLVYLSAGDSIEEISKKDNLTVPTIIVIGIWLVIYVLCWQALVGFSSDEEQPWEAGKPAVWAVLGGCLATILVIVGIVLTVTGVLL